MSDTRDGQMVNFALCDVLSIDDSSEGCRIKVSIPGTSDAGKSVDELPFCFPLLPKLISINPKVGEKVFVFFQSPSSREAFRAFIGPIIMQDYMLGYAPGSLMDGRTVLSTSRLSENDMGPFEAPSRNPENDGTVPQRDAIVLKGRANTDIVLKQNETQIRCGFTKNPHSPDLRDRLNYNPVDPGYIQLKYRNAKDKNGNDFKSSVNIVADRINLLSYDSPSYIGNLGEKALVNDERMQEIFDKAHQLPYGDELVAFLKEFVRVFREHTHPFHQKPPCLNEVNEKAISVNLDDMLSKSIRIN